MYWVYRDKQGVDGKLGLAREQTSPGMRRLHVGKLGVRMIGNGLRSFSYKFFVSNLLGFT